VNSQKLSSFVAFFLLLSLPASCSNDVSEGSESDFCEKLQILAGPDSALTNLTLDNSQLVNQTIADLLELASEAPSSISNETQAVASLYEDILSKIVSVSPSQRTAELRKFQAELDQITTSARALELYGETECGLKFISPFETSSTPVPQVNED
tara:strand:- start:795 stop:1256 length:462 start_codon:yes stop_codon:yes gene_type:complete